MMQQVGRNLSHWWLGKLFRLDVADTRFCWNYVCIPRVGSTWTMLRPEHSHSQERFMSSCWDIFGSMGEPTRTKQWPGPHHFCASCIVHWNNRKTSCNPR